MRAYCLRGTAPNVSGFGFRVCSLGLRIAGSGGLGSKQSEEMLSSRQHGSPLFLVLLTRLLRSGRQLCHTLLEMIDKVASPRSGDAIKRLQDSRGLRWGIWVQVLRLEVFGVGDLGSGVGSGGWRFRVED